MPIKFEYNGKPVEVYFDSQYTDRRHVTTCVMTIHGLGVFAGAAICAPADAVDRELGKRLAFKRAREAFADRAQLPVSLRQKFHRDMRFAYRHAVQPELAPYPGETTFVKADELAEAAA